MSVEQSLLTEGGVARTSRLLRLGHSPHQIRRSIASGEASRPRRGWLALASADPELVLAALHGVVLSCVTQAARLGLWVLRHDELHVAAPRGRHVDLPGSARVHWHAPLIPRGPGLLADHLENTLDCVARCRPHDEALAVWDSALQQRLTDYPKLAALPLGPRARKLLLECTPFSDSGLESIFRTRLRWLRIPVRPQCWAHGRRVDFLIGDRLVVQIDGRDHVGRQRTDDNEHDAELRLRGYHVIRVGYEQVVHRWHEVEAMILEALARGLHLAR
ncbi:DNA/RNA helicase [Leucobacter sp. UCD-THU]|uniref:DUF559 domain-containing protein n=1 Tax=Leucobacter sp. UCD-THU TaxID=1292023 RepID=UPI00045F6E98|nr:DUF559 domain-containing protein [Leucobacter sp. UCD-THU]EYT54401.1 DNA/RNA helicase [Leucobacter sp. UCD-THU]